jgi:uncharacterized damage-inducible protein DinB
MPISQLLLPEFDQEMANTRKTLERVPAEKWDWKPHSKSGSLGWLAAHVATLPNFTITMANTDEYEIDGGHRVNVKGHSEMLPTFDDLTKQAREALSSMSDEKFQQTWTLKFKGHVIFAMPRYAAIRSAGFNHVFHHRGQLTVYLRLLDIPVPGLYGPSADEQFG